MSGINLSYFEDQLNCGQTSKELQQLFESISGWLENNGLHSDQLKHRFSSIDALVSDNQSQIIFVAEFSRGKSELINSILFESLGRRYLPTSPGRTTRCTTILHYNSDELPSIKLLPTLGPTETQTKPISMLKQNPDFWRRTLFSASDAESAIKAINQITEVELVDADDAIELGYSEILDKGEFSDLDRRNGKFEIPKYRHAIVNFPHPLLKQGLSIIDTPDLNSFGIDSEYSLRSLEAANAVIFILSADTGITRSELVAWNGYIKWGSAENVIVVINKIDTLWDELKTKAEINSQIKTLVVEVAKTLDIPVSRIFPVSAQKSLVARKNNDQALTLASGINQYEQALADMINRTNRNSIVEHTRVGITTSLVTIQNMLQQQAKDTKERIYNTQSQKQDKSIITENNILAVKKEREQLEKVNKETSLIRVHMEDDYENFVKELNIFSLDKLIARYRFEISSQLTTTGLRREMNLFLLEAVEKFSLSLVHVSELELKLKQLYQRVEKNLEIKGLVPRKINQTIYLDVLSTYREKHEKYVRGITMVLTEQNVLRDRYYASVMVKIRKLYIQTRSEVELWCRTVLVPLELELKEKESQLKKRLLTLERVRTEDFGIRSELNILESRLKEHEQRTKTVAHFICRLEELSEENKFGI